MWLLNIKLNIRKRLRALEIIRLVLAHLIRNWYVGTWLARLIRPKAKTEHEARSNAAEVRIRELIEDLGPTFVKFGQILADRPDLVSPKLRTELKKLQTTARPISDDEAIALIEKELGGPLDIFFESLNMECIASASIGQVYSGVLKNGDKVVIKIQRPHILTKIKIDLILLKVVATYLAKRYPQAASLNIVSLVDEFSASLMKELDYHAEASNILQFTERMKDEPAFYAPKVYNEYTTTRLLIMEAIEGISPDDIERLEKEGYDLHQIAVNGGNILLKMILEHGIFHADPHAGNIFILPGNRVCFIDFGMVAVLRPAHIQFLADFTMGFALTSAKKIAAALIKLSGQRFITFKEDLRFDVQQTINRYSYQPIEKVNIAAVMLECVTLIMKYKLQIPSSIYMLLKALATISKLGEQLSPKFEFSALLVPYARDVIRKEFSPMRFFSELSDVFVNYADMVKEFPIEVSEILHKARQGKLVHEMSFKEDTKLGKSLRGLGINLALGIAAIMLIVCSTVLSAKGQSQGIATAQLIFGIIAGAWLLLRLFKRSIPA
jgi:ubiquinone biosynthesis protein